MLEFLKWRMLKQDASPGSLIYAGPPRSFAPHLCEYRYDSGKLYERCMDEIPGGLLAREHGEDASDAASGGATRLLHLTGVHDADMVRRLGAWLAIHPLVQEDIMNTGQRPQFQADGDAVFMVFKDIGPGGGDSHFTQYHTGIFWKGSLVLAFQEQESPAWDGVLERIRSGKGRIRDAGASYLAVALIDAVVDKYYLVLEELNRRAEEVEAELAERQTENALMRLYALKREVVILRSTFVSVRDSLDKLADQDSCPMDERSLPFLADVHDHAQHVVDTSTALHDILSDMLNVQISLAGMRMNNVMKVLTVIATIFIPLTFISGIYGMNFTNMPELHWAYGYPAVLLIMALLAGVMVWLFRRKDWF